MIAIRPKNEVHAISEWFYDNTARDLKFIFWEIYVYECVCIYMCVYRSIKVKQA